MFGTKKTTGASAFAIYAACAMACGSCVALAGLAFHLSREMVGPAAAQVELRAVLPVDLPLTKLAVVSPPAELRAAPVQPDVKSPIAPVVISHAQVLTAGGVAGDAVNAHPPEDGDIDEWAGFEPWTPGRSDTYRTVCVRLCDGAYFPMSFSTTRDRFKADAARCKSGCDSPSKLFVVKPEGAADDMVDVRGGSYGDLPNAFKFRTSYDAACTCRSQPWEAKAVERHRQLASAAMQVPSAGGGNIALAQPVAPAQSMKPSNSNLSTTTGSRTTNLPGGPVEIAALDPQHVPVLAPRSPVNAVPNQSVPVPPAAANRAASLNSGTAPVEVPVVSVGNAVSDDVTAVLGDRHARAVKKPAQTKLTKAEPQVANVVAPEIPKAAKPKVVVVTQNRRTQTRVAALPPPRPVTRVATGAASSQRPFRSNDYWRLSFWEVKN